MFLFFVFVSYFDAGVHVVGLLTVPPRVQLLINRMQRPQTFGDIGFETLSHVGQIMFQVTCAPQNTSWTNVTGHLHNTAAHNMFYCATE